MYHQTEEESGKKSSKYEYVFKGSLNTKRTTKYSTQLQNRISLSRIQTLRQFLLKLPAIGSLHRNHAVIEKNKSLQPFPAKKIAGKAYSYRGAATQHNLYESNTRNGRKLSTTLQ